MVMKKRLFVPLFVALCLFPVLLPGRVQAATYRYIDKQGSISFADDLQVIPEEYRSKAVLIEGELKEDTEKASAPAAQDRTGGKDLSASAPADNAPQAASNIIEAPGGESLFGKRVYLRLMITGAVLLVGVAFLVAIGKIAALKQKEQVRLILRSSLIAALLLYLGIAHAGDVIALFSNVGNKLEAVQQKSAERGRKAAEAMKKMEAISGQLEQMQKEEEAQMKELEKGQETE